MIAPLPGVTDAQARLRDARRCRASRRRSSTTPAPRSRPGEGGLLVVDRPWPGHGPHGLGRPAALPRRVLAPVRRAREHGGYFLAGDGASYDADGDIWLLGRVDDVDQRLGPPALDDRDRVGARRAPGGRRGRRRGRRTTPSPGRPSPRSSSPPVARARRRRRRLAGRADALREELRAHVAARDRARRQAAARAPGARPAQDPLGQDHAPPARADSSTAAPLGDVTSLQNPWAVDAGRRTRRTGVPCCRAARDHRTPRSPHDQPRPPLRLPHACAARRRHPRRRPPVRARCRSTRRRRSCSRTPPTPPTCSRCRSTGTSTPASATRRSPRSRSGSPRSRAGSARSRPRRAWPRSSSRSPRSSARATTSSPPPQLYGGTVTQLDVTLRRFGVDTTFVPGTDPADYAAAIRPETKVRLRRGHREPVRRDRRPRRAGRGRARRRRPARRRRDARHARTWCRPDRARRRHRHPLGHQVPRRARHHARRRRRRVGPVRLGQRPVPADDRAGRLLRRRALVGATSASTGSSPSCASSSCATSAPRCRAQSAFQLLQGVETLPQRMDAHLANARAVARVARGRPARGVRAAGPGCPSHPHHERAQQLPAAGPGRGVRVRRRAAAARRPRGRARSSSALQLASHLANVGDARTLVHPPRLDHPPAAQRRAAARAAGVPADLVRISVGLEDVEDILWDLDQALTAATGATRPRTGTDDRGR